MRLFNLARFLFAVVAAFVMVSCESHRKDDPMNNSKSPPPGQNRLAFEKSPYLLQHAANPVDWYAWNDDAFAQAEKLDRPVFLSIGYSTCHWCHVMEHESFEDDSLAQMMNEAFINIKVDREERPDIDGIYMTVCQMMTGRGGWPLTIIMTPDKRPFFAGTYIPRNGMVNLVGQVVELWSSNRSALDETLERVVAALQSSASFEPGDALGRDEVNAAYRQLAASFDSSYGGFGGAPKFPSPHNLTFLLRHFHRTGDDNALTMVTRTLDQMRRGGIYDQLGFGFHRYSTDHRWFLPHFEKMLYDQAMLMMAYAEAYAVTRDENYKHVVEEIAVYVERDLTDAVGGFYSAEDADSEGEEGKFYVWSAAELEAILGEDVELAASVWGIEDEGNWFDEAHGTRPGTNVLALTRPVAEIATALNTEEAALRSRIADVRERLLAARSSRIRPGRDDKVLTDWNGLMIAALAQAARLCSEPRYAAMAERAARFVLDSLVVDKQLLHRYRDGESAIPAMVDDYAFMIWGFLELYQTTFEVSYLRRAVDLQARLDDSFWDDAAGGYFFTADDAEPMIVRQKEIYDGAAPSGNSVAMLNLLRLHRLTGSAGYADRAERLGQAFSSQVERGPSAFTQLMQAADFSIGPTREVVIVGEPTADDTQAMIKRLREEYSPNMVVILKSAAWAGELSQIAPYTATQTSIGNKATAYVCQNFSCDLPTNSPDEMTRLLSD